MNCWRCGKPIRAGGVSEDAGDSWSHNDCWFAAQQRAVEENRLPRVVEDAVARAVKLLTKTPHLRSNES